MAGPRARERMRTGRNVLVLTYWSFSDALIQAYTLPYVRLMADAIGDDARIHLLTLDRSKVDRIGETGDPRIVHISIRYRSFGIGGVLMILIMLIRSLWIIVVHRVGTIHAWCTPAGAIGHLLSLLTGRGLIVDSYEPHAEAMVENGTWKRNGLRFRALFAMEKAQTHRAVHLIAASSRMSDHAKRSFGYTGEMFVKPACVDFDRFPAQEKDPQLMEALGLGDGVIMVYAGKFGGIYLDQEVFDLFKVAAEHWGAKTRFLLLTPHPEESLLPMITKAGLDRKSVIIRFVPHAEVYRYMALGDVAITPVRPVPTKRYCTPIKNGEYWALGLPVIITPEISDDSQIIKKHGIGSVLLGLDRSSYLRALRELDDIWKENDRLALARRIRAIARQYRSFDKARSIYERIYGSEG